MAYNYRKESPKFDGTNYDSYKEKIKSHFFCMGLGHLLITKNNKTLVEKDKIEGCSEAKRELFVGYNC